MQELIESQRQYQQLLRQMLDEHRQQVDAVQQLLEPRKILCPRCDSLCYASSLGYASQTSINSPTADIGASASQPGTSQGKNQDTSRPTPLFPQISVTSSTAQDTRLTKWLQGLGIDNISIDRIQAEEYCLEDILFHITRDDLRRLHLR